MLENTILSRRKLLGLAGAAGAVYVAGAGRDGRLFGFVDVGETAA
jgi:hypothetical protein